LRLGLTRRRKEAVVQTVALLDEGHAESTVRIVQGAISRREPIVARYKGHRLILCPHILGRRQDRHYLLALLVNTTPPFQWSWIPVAEIRNAAVGDGPWFTTPSETWPSSEYLEETEAAAEPLVRSQVDTASARAGKVLPFRADGRLGITLGLPPERNERA
jgi:hypothetical protein